MHEIVSKDLVKGLPALVYKHSPTCDACIRGKQVRSLFKPKKMVSTSTPCEILHIDLCGPMRVRSIQVNLIFQLQLIIILDLRGLILFER